MSSPTARAAVVENDVNVLVITEQRRRHVLKTQLPDLTLLKLLR